jgi:hydroxyacylglutathione hydrolase
VIQIQTIETSSLGDRSYLATDGQVAVVIDPQRDIDRVLDLVEQRGLRLTHVLETHVHNDYVTGGLELAARTGATYVLPTGSDARIEHHAVRDGDVLDAGALRLRVLHTPGHTHHHVSYVLETALYEDGGRCLRGSSRPAVTGLVPAVSEAGPGGAPAAA